MGCFVRLGLLLLPVLITLFWGGELADRAYGALRTAQNVVAGRGVAFDVTGGGVVGLLSSSLFVPFLIVAGWMGVPLHLAAAFLSGLGWGVTAVTLYTLGLKWKRPFTALIFATLLATNPLIITTLGTATSWIAGLIALSLLIFVKRRGDAGAKKVRLWAANWLNEESRIRLTSRQLAFSLSLAVGLPLLIFQIAFLWQQSQLQPRARQQLEREAAVWLQQNSPESATLVASPHFGYLADRVLQFNDNGFRTADWKESDVGLGRLSDPATLPTLLNQLITQPPSYFITSQTVAATYLVETGWFQERYQLARQFPAVDGASVYGTSSDVGAPLLIWEQRPSPLDETVSTPVVVRAEDRGLDLRSYQLTPRRIEPGVAVHVQLNWQSDYSPPPFLHTVVRLVSPQDRVVWAQRDLSMPRSLPPEWIESETIFPERFVLTTTADIPVGAYLVTTSLYHPREEGFVVLHQDGDANELDRVNMGYVVVPWRGEVAQTAVSLNATFGDQIKLLSCDCVETAVSGQTINVQLYWEAMRPPDDNYVVFVHLLDGDGQFIVGHDAPPFEGRYDTKAWLPGDIIPDDHPLTLPPELPPGSYDIRVGLYQPESGPRLSATDAQGNLSPEQSILLPAIQVVVQNN